MTLTDAAGKKRRLLPLAFCAFTAACGGSTFIQTAPAVPPKSPLRLTAVVAGGAESDFTNQLEAELVNRGYGILDHARTASLLQSLGVAGADATGARARGELQSRRIDSVMKVDVTNIPDHPKLLDKVILSVTGVDDALVLTAFVWTNSWGGMPTSGADYIMRMSPAAAAREVAEALIKQLGAPGEKTSPKLDAPVAAPSTAAVSTDSPPAASDATPAAAASGAPTAKPWWEK